MASIGSYLYGVADDAIAVHVYGDSTARLQVGGTAVTLQQESRYPWDGAVAITIAPEMPTHFTLHLRIPGWCAGATLAVNGEAVDVAAAMTDGYVAITRDWAEGDAVRLDLQMRPERFFANPRIRQDLGRVALRRGPLLYCAEETDNLPRSATMTESFEPNLLGGIVTLRAEALRDDAENWHGALYRDVPPKSEGAALTAVPYFAWDNRDGGDMLVWLRDQA